MIQQVDFKPLTEAIRDLVCEVKRSTDLHQREHDLYRCSLATKHDLNQATAQIMSALSDFLGKQTAYNARLDAAITGLTNSLSEVAGDITTLNDKITELQNSPGGVTPEDQATIDALQTQGEALATKLEGVKSALDALNELTPPKAPPTP